MCKFLETLNRGFKETVRKKRCTYRENTNAPCPRLMVLLSLDGQLKQAKDTFSATQHTFNVLLMSQIVDLAMFKLKLK